MGSCIVNSKEQKETHITSTIKTIKLLKNDKTNLDSVRIATPKPITPSISLTKCTGFSEHIGILVNPKKYC